MVNSATVNSARTTTALGREYTNFSIGLNLVSNLTIFFSCGKGHSEIYALDNNESISLAKNIKAFTS